MQSSTIIGERLCEKCRTLLNECRYFSPTKDGSTHIDHYKSVTDLQASADGGCRSCQIIWMHMSWVDRDGLADYVMLIIKESYLRAFMYGSSEFGFSMRLEHTATLDTFWSEFEIHLLDTRKPHRELPPISRLASENINEVRTLMQTTLRWIDSCSQNHEKCQRTQNLKEKFNVAPTRLIDVQSNDNSTVRLVDTKELSSEIKPTYLILSYCWGLGNEAAKTTRNNLHQRKQRIMVCDLPKTIRDAITVTRATEVRYLWVDALCIIQPDNDNFLGDWNTEAAQMGSYYSNALFCISALCTSDSSDGFLRERHSARYPWRREECIQHEENFFSIIPSKGLHDIKIRHTPLMERAWALQERILSTRRLHWSGIGLLWECDSGLFQENQPLRNLRQQHNENYIGARTDNFIREILSLPKEEALGIAWLGIIVQYSDMQLTKPTDRLAAIHGVARRLSLQHNVEYFGGIFKGFYSRALLWECTKIGHEDDGFIRKDFPSWSWASAVKFSYDRNYFLGKSSSGIKDLIRYANPGQPTSLDEIIDFGDRSKRKLALRAPLISMKLEPQEPIQPEISTSYNDFYRTIDGPIWKGQKIYCHMDCKMKSLEPSAVTLLICYGDFGQGMRTAPDNTVPYKGLILRISEEDGPGAFVRLGHFRVYIPWSEEEEEGGYLNDWETDVYLF